MRIRFRRPLAGLVASLLLLTGASELFGAHLCPEHDSATHRESSEAAATVAHVHHHDQGGDAPSPGTSHGPCSCLGACPPPSATALPVEDESIAVSGLDRVQLAAFVALDVVLPRFNSFLNPESQGPPLFA